VSHLQSDRFLRAEWTIPSKCVDLKDKRTLKTGLIHLERLSHLKPQLGTVLAKPKVMRGQNNYGYFYIRTNQLLTKNTLRSPSHYHLKHTTFQTVYTFTTVLSSFFELLLWIFECCMYIWYRRSAMCRHRTGDLWRDCKVYLYIVNHLKTKFLLNNIHKSSSYLTGKTLRLP
jgi:hypothetical protein